MTFKETGLCDDIIHATKDLGFEQPTPIQEQIIPLILASKKDLISLAQTGTGKTAAFGLPLIQKSNLENQKIQSIILCPTRELCMQISSDIVKYSKYTRGFKSVAVYGGADIRAQINSLKAGCHMVVGTPGRVMDLIKRKALRLSNVNWKNNH